MVLLLVMVFLAICYLAHFADTVYSTAPMQCCCEDVGVDLYQIKLPAGKYSCNCTLKLSKQLTKLRQIRAVDLFLKKLNFFFFSFSNPRT